MILALIGKTRGKGSVSSTRQIRALVQECFDAAYLRMKDEGLAEEVQDLKSATVHWLRHTGISEDVKLRPREHVRDDAGHASMQATDATLNPICESVTSQVNTSMFVIFEPKSATYI